MDAVGRSDRRNYARGLHRQYLFKKLDVVIDDIFQRRGTVVVEVGSGLSNAVESRNIEFVPVIERGGRRRSR